MATPSISSSIFKAYDIRGIVDGDPAKVTLTDAVARGVGAAARGVLGGAVAPSARPAGGADGCAGV
jgi:phosphomannomutase